MNLLNVHARGVTLVNLDHIRCIETECGRETAEIKFVYTNGEEDIFWVSLGRLAVIVDILHDFEGVPS